jgi:demethylmenaquinone methyltransferase/2-methoxy-6-polyprenyl-1,4-benzoquinol methylase
MTVRKGVQKIYSEVAETYELVNHILTLGLDIHWRKKAARIAAKNIHIFAVDFSFPMLKKAAQKTYTKNLVPTLADAGILPFRNESFDVVTISFATRNLNVRKKILESHLEEFNRVLRPGGLFINLETSQPSKKILRQFFHLYVRCFVRPVGWILSGSKAGYRYLAFTIPRFYPPDEFAEILRRSGFSQVEYKRLFFGISAIHVAKK